MIICFKLCNSVLIFFISHWLILNEKFLFHIVELEDRWTPRGKIIFTEEIKIHRNINNISIHEFLGTILIVQFDVFLCSIVYISNNNNYYERDALKRPPIKLAMRGATKNGIEQNIIYFLRKHFSSYFDTKLTHSLKLSRVWRIS